MQSTDGDYRFKKATFHLDNRALDASTVVSQARAPSERDLDICHLLHFVQITWGLQAMGKWPRWPSVEQRLGYRGAN